MEIGNCSGRSKVSGGKMENSNRVKEGNGRLKCGGLGRSIQEQVGVHMRGVDGVRRGNYFGFES